MTKNENFIELEGLKKATFTIEGKTKEYSIFKLVEFHEFLGNHLKSCANMIPELNYYKDFENEIDEILDKKEKDWESGDEEDLFEYSVGGNYAKYLNTGRKIAKNLVVSDNNAASDILEAEMKKIFPNNTLSFDSESSHCYVYTKNRKEAKIFLLHVYNKYIKETLKDWFVGWEDFVEEFKNATEEEKNKLINLGY